MRVKAIKEGYYGLKRRRIGEVFELRPVKGKNAKGEKVTFSAESLFSTNWMVKVDPRVPVGRPPTKAEIRKGTAISQVQAGEDPNESEDDEEEEFEEDASESESDSEQPTGDASVI